MKNQFVLIAAALVMATALTGCKKTPKNVTPLTNRDNPPPFVAPPTTAEPAPAVSNPGNGVNNATTPRNTQPTPGGVFTPNDGNGSRNLTPITPVDPNKPSELSARPTDVVEDPTILQTQTVYFDYDAATLKKAESSKVEAVAAFLKNEPTSQIRIEGNSDERGTEEYNRALGERRALAVREYLVGLGVAPERLTTISYGEDKPADSGHDEAAWTKNRRGDFVVLRPNSSAK